ncbi:hypothetical protein FHR32_005074 [Streptosporangium album]|uniref:Uncharacterized protein n=1 Tax=Streptosporangium album TaxID=47479 RepID=A0A7W7RZ09_9ACTN|nr:hypothetical protein [Streptosporangium album]MBB4940697.1 hypothetical protein [Streptosporangium album]
MISNELALVEVVLKAMTERLKAAKTNADAEIRATALPGDRTNAVLPDGTVIGSVSQAKGRTSAAVTDRVAFTKWAQAEHPTEVELVPTVRPAFERRVLDGCKANGVNVDANGHEVPGVEVGQGNPYSMTKVTGGAEDAIAAAYQSGELADVLERFARPALEAGAE